MKQGNVQVDNVAFFERPSVRNSLMNKRFRMGQHYKYELFSIWLTVTDNFIEADANTAREKEI
jgi:hypothetical protein